MDTLGTPTEKIFYEFLNKNFNVKFEGNFIGRSNYKAAMNSFMFSMNDLVDKNKKRTLYVAYQLKLNDRDNKYPDFLISCNNKNLRIEIKFSDNERTIAKEINSIDRIKDDEFWFIMFGNKNIRKISNEATKKNSKIKIFAYDEKNLLNKINDFFL